MFFCCIMKITSVKGTIMALERKKIKTQLCVVGGGLAGLNVAVTAARLGIKVVLVHERPVIGGNASGEIRMWVCGAQDYVYRETGLAEEIALENYFYNPTKNYNIWNALLYGKAKNEENLQTLMNCTCFNADTVGGKIEKIVAYQMTTQTIFEVEAEYFADCSGDSILAPLTGAEFMYGREGVDEYGEPMKSHFDPDKKTMGNSCLIQARQTNRKVEFHAPAWAEKVPLEKLRQKGIELASPYANYWQIELGGAGDVIGDAECLNERLIGLCLGIWDTIKNSGAYDADNYELEFLGFLAAKRESRRMKGDYVLTANDVINGKIFADTVAYGGWPLDDHNPNGFDGVESNYAITLKGVYGIPYRCLYSTNVDNLFFAGRNISATHMAMSSARVMGTCSVIGQAVGVATYLACKYRTSPRGVGEYMEEMQQLLLKYDCYLPTKVREVSALCKNAELSGLENVEILRNGRDRYEYNENNSVLIKNGESVQYTFDTPTRVEGIKIVFDSDLLRETYDVNYCEKHHSMRCNIFNESPVMSMPKTLAKEYTVEITDENGNSRVLTSEKKNKQRNLLLPIGEKLSSVKLTVRGNWGESEKTNVFTFEVY